MVSWDLDPPPFVDNAGTEFVTIKDLLPGDSPPLFVTDWTEKVFPLGEVGERTEKEIIVGMTVTCDPEWSFVL